MATDPESRLGIYFLDVGQGDCTFVVPPKGEGGPVLMDCADAYVAERFVSNHEITELGAVIASHLDIDHVRGLLPFLKQYFEQGGIVRELVIGLDRPPQKKLKKQARELLAHALHWERNPPHPGFYLAPPWRAGLPHVVSSGSNWGVELVLPHYGYVLGQRLERGEQPNACSAVLRVKRKETAVLIGGDAELGTWERLEPERRAAIAIRAPHHGGEIRRGGETWKEFSHLYDAVEAGTGVISVGTNNPSSWGHPIPEHVGALQRSGACRVLCTQLTPRCHPEPGQLREKTMRTASGVEWPYRHHAERGHPRRRPPSEVPCAGSVVLWLDDDGHFEIEPAAGEWHDELLDYVAKPLCRS